MSSLLVLTGLLVAGCGSAILNDWRNAAVLWERFDSRFPLALQTPPGYAGTSLFLLGATMALLPLLPA